MQGLALVQALFPKVWLPTKALPLGRQPTICVKRPNVDEESSECLSTEQALVAKKVPVDVRSQLSGLLNQPPKSSSVDVMKEYEPQGRQELPASQEASPITSPKVDIPVKTVAPSLLIQGPGSFQVATTMISEKFGVVAYLPHRQSGLSGQDYMMLSKLISACRQLLSIPSRSVDFSFFRWPPTPGLAQSLDSHVMGLGALKGFLHKMAGKRHCSWLVFDPQFAEFCFQKAGLEAFALLPRGDQQLLISPALSELHEQSALKQKLWQALKPVLEGR